MTAIVAWLLAHLGIILKGLVGSLCGLIGYRYGLHVRDRELAAAKEIEIEDVVAGKERGTIIVQLRCALCTQGWNVGSASTLHHDDNRRVQCPRCGNRAWLDDVRRHMRAALRKARFAHAVDAAADSLKTLQ